MPTNPFSSGPKGYNPKSTSQLEAGVSTGVGNRAGATRKADGSYDYSNSFNPITGAAGIAKSTAGYDFNPMDQAIKGFQAPRSLSRVDFKNLPDRFGDVAYENMARDMRRESAGNLTRLNEQVGTRRPGLLLKSGQDANRDLSQQLAQGKANIERDIMEKNIDLDKDEQLANADLQKSETMLDLDRLKGLFGMGDTKIGTQSGLVGKERDYEDAGLDRLLEAWAKAGGFSNDAAQIKSQNRKASLDFLGSMMSGASKAATMGMG